MVKIDKAFNEEAFLKLIDRYSSITEEEIQATDKQREVDIVMEKMMLTDL
jgi:hypothetical protein